MNARPLALAALLLVAALPGLAQAAPRARACNLVVDAADDTAPVPAESVDIVSADIASDPRKLTAVIRLKKVGDTEPSAPLGRNFQINFTGQGGRNYAFLAYFTTPTGSSFNYGYHNPTTGFDEGQGTVLGKVDAQRNEIRMTVPVATLGGMPETGSFKSGARISAINVRVSRWLGAYANADYYAGASSPVDSAEATKTYVGNTPSCVRV